MLKKNDIKYIIKRVIIILITGFIFFNINRCSVYAETIDLSNISASNRCTENLLYNSDIGQSSRWYCSSSANFSVSSTLSYSNTNLYYDTYNIKNYVNVGSSNYNIKYYILYDSTNDYYIIVNAPSNNYSNNTFNITSNESGYISLVIFVSGRSLVPTTIVSNSTMSFTSSNNLYNTSNYNNLYLYSIENINVNDIDLNNLYIYDTNIDNLSITIDNISLEEYSPIVPSNYTQIDLTGYQAVLITPKNYETMLSNSSHTEQPAPGVFNTYLDFNFYSQYCTRPSLINISNTKEVILNENGVNIGGVASLSGTCPAEPTSYTLSYQYDMYTGYIPYGLLIYNTQINQEDNWNTSNTYMTSYVWYDSSLYNYQLISDTSSLDLDINYIDYAGQNKTLEIEQLPTLDELFQNALDTYEQSSTEEFDSNKLQNFLEFVKLPFTFLAGLNTNSCQPLSLPFPHTNTNINVPCMSTIYEEHLPDSLINVIKVIINGLLFYRITLSNISIIRQILDPTDDKLEVLEL